MSSTCQTIHYDVSQYREGPSLPPIFPPSTTVVNLYLYLYTIFDQRRLDIIDQVEHGRSPQQVTHLPPVWDLLLPLA